MKYYINEDKSVRLYSGDCLEVMDKMIKKGVKIDGIMTSPPYNIIRPSCTDRGYDLYKDGLSQDKYSEWCCNIFDNFNKLLKKDTCVLWNMSYGSENTEGMNLTIADIIKNTEYTLADIIIWKKSNATPNNSSKNKRTRIVEFIYVFCRKSELKTFNSNKKVKSVGKNGQKYYENVYNFIEAKNNDGACELNKATYSSDLCKKLMSFYYSKGGIILDPFNGTGTTGVACKYLGMQYIGIELSENQFKYSINRLKED